MDREQERDRDMDREREQCIEWVRDQLRALRHTNRVYEQHVIRDIESRTKRPVPAKSTEAEAEVEAEETRRETPHETSP